jgi:hypothetical protein
MKTNTLEKPAYASKSKTGGVDLGQDQSREAKRVAAAVLEVLAGVRTPTEAAIALTMSVTHYYQVESRALRGLLAACEPLAKGRGAESEVTTLRHENQRLQRENLRQQALVRAAQRSVGLAAPVAPTPTKNGGKKFRQRRVVRALSVAARLQQQTTDAADPAAMPTNSHSPLPEGEGSGVRGKV